MRDPRTQERQSIRADRRLRQPRPPPISDPPRPLAASWPSPRRRSATLQSLPRREHCRGHDALRSGRRARDRRRDCVRISIPVSPRPLIHRLRRGIDRSWLRGCGRRSMTGDDRPRKLIEFASMSRQRDESECAALLDQQPSGCSRVSHHRALPLNDHERAHSGLFNVRLVGKENHPVHRLHRRAPSQQHDNASAPALSAPKHATAVSRTREHTPPQPAVASQKSRHQTPARDAIGLKLDVAVAEHEHPFTHPTEVMPRRRQRNIANRRHVGHHMQSRSARAHAPQPDSSFPILTFASFLALTAARPRGVPGRPLACLT